MVTISGAGEKLSEVLGEYVDALRAEGPRTARAALNPNAYNRGDWPP
ncbi:MAG: hypothetical protein R2849_02095 [Thermomicrobiales bacterium]